MEDRAQVAIPTQAPAHVFAATQPEAGPEGSLPHARAATVPARPRQVTVRMGGRCQHQAWSPQWLTSLLLEAGQEARPARVGGPYFSPGAADAGVTSGQPGPTCSAPGPRGRRPTAISFMASRELPAPRVLWSPLSPGVGGSWPWTTRLDARAHRVETRGLQGTARSQQLLGGPRGRSWEEGVVGGPGFTDTRWAGRRVRVA